MIVALVAVVVMVAGVILWRFFGDALSNRSHTAAARCVGGKDTVAVIADPSIADQVKESADSYNASAARSATVVWQWLSPRPAPMPSSMVSSANGRPNWAASRDCGFRVAPSRRRGLPGRGQPSH